MSITAGNNLGSGQANNNNQTSVSMTTSASASIGQLVVLIIAVDNESSVDGDNSDVISIVDTGLNVWVKAAEYTNSEGGSKSGAVCSIWYSKLTTGISAGATITANFSISTNHDAAAISAYSFSTTGTIQLRGSSVSGETNADPGSLDYTSPNSEHLRVRGIACEDSATTSLTVTSGWTAFEGNQTSGGQSNANMGVRGEFRIITATTAASNPTLFASDSASVYITLYEVAVVTQTKTANLNSILQKAVSKTTGLQAQLLKQAIEVNAGLQAQIQRSGILNQTSVDGLLASQILKTLSVDSIILKQGIGKTIGLDSNLRKTVFNYVGFDSRLSANHVINTILDSRLQKEITKQLSADSYLQKALVLSASIDLLIKKLANENNANLDSLLQNAAILNSDLDAVLVGITAATTNLDSYLQNGVLLNSDFDAALAIFLEGNIGLDSLLSKAVSISSGVDSNLQKTESIATSADSILQKTINGTTGIDANILQAAITLSTSFDSILTQIGSNFVTSLFDARLSRESLEISVNLDAALSVLGELYISMDSILVASSGASKSVFVDSLLMVLVSSGTSFDSLLKKTIALSAGVDATLVLLGNIQTGIDSELLKNIGMSLSLNAILLGDSLGNEFYFEVNVNGHGNFVSTKANVNSLFVKGSEALVSVDVTESEIKVENVSY